MMNQFQDEMTRFLWVEGGSGENVNNLRVTSTSKIVSTVLFL